VTRAVLHVDMDAFYASIEQHDDPALAGKPVIVGWSGGRGVVAAASYEVRRFGVHSAMPMRTALRLCPDALCVRPRMQRYQDVSAVVFGVFREITPLVQGLSLDEAFLDVTASKQLLGSGVDIARRIKSRIRELTGLCASVGVAPNKLVAKIASDLEKPDGLTEVTQERVREVLDPLSVRRLPGLGRKTGARVEAAGIHTLGELRGAPDAILWPIFGRYCAWIRERASGVDERPVLPDMEDKSLSAEDTFEEDIADPRLLQRQLARLADLAGSRLRGRGLVAGCIGVKIRRDDFSTFTRQRAVAPPTGEGRAIGGVAAELLTRWLAANPDTKLRLLGVVLTELTPAAQLGLFEDPRQPSGIDAALDEVRGRFGSHALRRGDTIE
jgi:DNA polymerase-4